MSGYIFILFWLAMMVLVANLKNTKRYELVHGMQEQRTKIGFAIMAFLPVIIWAGFRSGAGYADTNAYIFMYSQIPRKISKLVQYLSHIEKDIGFAVFSSIIKLIFGTNYTPFLLIIAVIQGGIIVTFFRRYSSNYLMSIFLFIASAEYVSWMFNGIRQFLAVVIIVAATPLMLKKKYFSLILIILLASTFHQTALIMIPVVFIVQGKPWNWKTILLIILAIGVLFYVEQFTGFLDEALSETQYSNTVSTWQEMGDDGSNPIRVMIYCIPALLALFGRKQLATKSTPIVNLCVNMSIISGAIYLISMVTSGIMIGRLPIYVSLYSYILLPYEVDCIFTKESAKMVKLSLVAFYLLYYYYLMHFAYGRI